VKVSEFYVFGVNDIVAASNNIQATKIIPFKMKRISRVIMLSFQSGIQTMSVLFFDFPYNKGIIPRMDLP